MCIMFQHILTPLAVALELERRQVGEFVDTEPLPHITDGISSQTLWRKPASAADQERHAFAFEQPHDRLCVGGNSQREPNQERNKSTVTTMAFSKQANVHCISVASCLEAVLTGLFWCFSAAQVAALDDGWLILAGDGEAHTAAALAPTCRQKRRSLWLNRVSRQNVKGGCEMQKEPGSE